MQGCGVVFALPIGVSFARIVFSLFFFLLIAVWVCCCSVIKGKGLGLCVADGTVIFFCIASHKFGQYGRTSVGVEFSLSLCLIDIALHRSISVAP